MSNLSPLPQEQKDEPIKFLAEIQNEFRSRLDLLGLDFSSVLVNAIKKKQGIPSCIDEQRKEAINFNIEKVIEAVKLVQAELSV